MGSSSDDSDLELLTQLSDWDGEETDEDDKRVRASRNRVNYTQSLDNAEFTFRFRIPKDVVNALLSEIMPFVETERNQGVQLLHQLLLTLRFYALGTMLQSVADFVGVSTSTACRIVRDISTAISRLYKRYIRVHTEHVDKFYKIAGFPKVFGAIDCTHVHIKPSYLVGEEFKNSKGHFSLNVQAVCDADSMFMDFDSRWPGSTDDATIFNKSDLRVQSEAGNFGNNWLLGDNAYSSRTYLLTPLLNPVTEAEQKYNSAHMKTWNTIKSALGLWKGRFPVVSLTLRLSLANASAVIIATAVLHNICQSNNLEEIPAEVELPTVELEGFQIKGHKRDHHFQLRADLIRNHFSN